MCLKFWSFISGNSKSELSVVLIRLDGWFRGKVVLMIMRSGSVQRVWILKSLSLLGTASQLPQDQTQVKRFFFNLKVTVGSVNELITSLCSSATEELLSIKKWDFWFNFFSVWNFCAVHCCNARLIISVQQTAKLGWFWSMSHNRHFYLLSKSPSLCIWFMSI